MLRNALHIACVPVAQGALERRNYVIFHVVGLQLIPLRVICEKNATEL